MTQNNESTLTNFHNFKRAIKEYVDHSIRESTLRNDAKIDDLRALVRKTLDAVCLLGHHNIGKDKEDLQLNPKEGLLPNPNSNKISNHPILTPNQ